jgi:hypothetical protein
VARGGAKAGGMTHYAASKSVRDGIFDALILRLADIKTSNGYINTIDSSSIFEESPQLSAATPSPWVVVYTFPEKVRTGSTRAKAKFLRVGVHFYTDILPAGMNARQWRDSMLLDFEYLIGNGPFLLGADGKPTCSLAEVGDNDPLHKILGETYTSIGSEINIEYRDDLMDGTVQI